MARGVHLHVVWFKRDLRVADHAALAGAVAAARSEPGGAVLGFYVVEPLVTGAEDYAGRHWAATAEALGELRVELARRGWMLAVRRGEAVEWLERLRRKVAGAGGQLSLWSHEETGNAVTYARDRAVARWAREQGVVWTEFTQNGVVRRLRSREGWAAEWERRVRLPIVPEPEVGEAPGWGTREGVDEGAIPTVEELGLEPDFCPGRQRGGRSEARRALETFLAYRGRNYNREMSSPRTAVEACSRLSVGLALGTVSTREVWQAAEARRVELMALRAAGVEPEFRAGALRAFLARLQWRCHFMQKLESEPRIEHEAFLPELDRLRVGGDAAERAARLDAWAEGCTGYPFIDACMRCLRATGWINFRMRAMLMSFAAYDLWLPWREAGLRLARLFTDYDPGIHWPQVQMQSGTTGINTLRMYSPVKQSLDQDPEAEFIRRWVPELAGLPAALVHEPWQAGRPMVGYPSPIVDHAAAVRAARAKFAAIRRSEGFGERARAVYARHGSRKRPGMQMVEPRWFEAVESGRSAQLELGLG